MVVISSHFAFLLSFHGLLFCPFTFSLKLLLCSTGKWPPHCFKHHNIQCQWSRKREIPFQKNRTDRQYCSFTGNPLIKTNWKNWINEWEGPILVFYGTSTSRAVAMLFPSTLEHEILRKYTDNGGQLLIIKYKLENSCYIIINRYEQYRNYVWLEI